MPRVAVLGYGSIGQRHVATVRESLHEGELLVYSSYEILGKPFASTTRLADITKFKPDLAIVCGAASKRLEAIRALPAETRGILIEKPFALNHQEGLEVQAALARKSSVVQVGYNLRFSASLVEFKQKLEERLLGSVVGVRAETGQHLSTWRPGRDYQSTVSANAALGGGVLRELSHEIDYLGWIFGDVGWVSAWSGRQSTLEVDVEDTAHITLGFRGTSPGGPIIGQLNLDFVRHDRARNVVAICDGGTLKWDGISGRVEQWLASGAEWDEIFVEAPRTPSTYLLQWEAFCRAVDGGEMLGATANDALKVLATIDAVRSSSNAGGQHQAPDCNGSVA